MAEFDTDRTYALPRLQYALCNPAGQPLSLHGSAQQALEAWCKKRALEANPRAFGMLLREKYSIRRAHAWCRVTDEIILKLPKEKPNVKPQIKRRRART